jgi:hypothetical protein
MSNRRGAILPGLFLILLGGWLLAQNLGARLPQIQNLWPAFPLVFGLAMLVRYFSEGRREEGLVFTGVAATLVGAFFFAFTLGPLEWAQMRDFWPVFVLIGSAAFFAQWLARPRNVGLLVPAVLALIVGGVFMLANTGALNRAMVNQLVKFWPVLLILGGLSSIASYLLRARRNNP